MYTWWLHKHETLSPYIIIVIYIYTYVFIWIIYIIFDAKHNQSHNNDDDWFIVLSPWWNENGFPVTIDNKEFKRRFSEVK